MMHRSCMLSVASALCLVLGSVAAADENLLPDSDFAETTRVIAEKGDEARRHGPDTPWTWHVIEAEANVAYSEGQAVASGGKVFLHSDDFEVDAGNRYEVTFTAEGDGKISAGLLWWQVSERGFRSKTEPHWTAMDEAEDMDTDGPVNVSAQFETPENADKAYLRLVVTDGSVTVRDLQVTAVDE